MCAIHFNPVLHSSVFPSCLHFAFAHTNVRRPHELRLKAWNCFGRNSIGGKSIWKSTLLNMIGWLSGDEFVSYPFSCLLSAKLGKKRNVSRNYWIHTRHQVPSNSVSTRNESGGWEGWLSISFMIILWLFALLFALKFHTTAPDFQLPSPCQIETHPLR